MSFSDKLAMRFALVCFLISFHFSVHAGLGRGWDYLTELESISYGLQTLTSLKGCADVDPQAGELAMLKAEKNCAGARSSIAAQTGQLQAITAAMRGDLEDRYFAIAAKHQALEYHCSAQFAETLANQRSEERAALTERLRLYRKAVRRVREISREISQNPAIIAKFCPLRLQELETSHDPARDELCRELIVTREAASILEDSIPLIEDESLKKFVEGYIAKPDGEKFTKYDQNLEMYFAAAMQKTADQLTVMQNDFEQRVTSRGGQAFDRDERNKMLNDPRLVAKVNAYGGDDPAFMGVACRADYRYGKGANKLETTVDIAETASYAVGIAGLSRLLVRLGFSAANAARTAQTARAIRTGGKLTSRGVRFLMGAGTVLSGTSLTIADIYTSIKDTCPASPDAVNKFNQCVSAPKIEEVKRDDCVLKISLDSIGYRPK